MTLEWREDSQNQGLVNTLLVERQRSRGERMAVANDGERALSHNEGFISKRETEILSLIGQGHSSKEVANTLFVSKRTVDFHLTNVFKKLGVSNRVQAIVVADRLGLIPAGTAFRTVHDWRNELQLELI
jgi:DNA-binding CsgD family transcriptional regulator